VKMTESAMMMMTRKTLNNQRKMSQKTTNQNYLRNSPHLRQLGRLSRR
jgi:hypothetical protein